MKPAATKTEITLAEDLILTVLRHKPGISGGEVWRVVKSLLNDEDQDIRDQLAKMEQRGMVAGVEKKGSALRFWSINNKVLK